jgi:biotin carboxyl carrier protein
VTLSAERVEQGGVVGMQITGMVGTAQPTVETDLGSVQCVRMTGGWRAYIPAAYNASAGAHEIAVTVNDTVVTRTITVVPHDFGTAETEAEPAATEAANEEFRGAIWPLYEQAARDKQWKGAFLCPVESYLILVDYGQVKQVDGVAGSRSNSTLLYTLPGSAVRAPAAGQVVLARELALTGNTVVIDHGCGVRSYLYGLASLDVKLGDTVERGQTVGTAGEELTMDFKLASKSVAPWALFQASGGLFWQEDA